MKMKRVLALVCAAVMVLCALPFSVAASVIEIDSKEALCAIADNLSGSYRLTKDIVFTAEDFAEGGTYYNDGNGFTPIGDQWSPFSGTFDGNGYSIVGLRMNVTSGEQDTLADMGLFGYLTGTVKNVRLYDLQYTHKIEEVETTAIDSYCIGSLVGRNWKGSIQNCAVYGQISVSAEKAGVQLGGLVGNNCGSIENCAAYVTLSGEREQYKWMEIGGLVGRADKDPYTTTASDIRYCLAAADISATDGSVHPDKPISVAALVGRSTVSNAKISDCYYISEISDAVAELSGNNTVERCIAVASDKATDANEFQNLDFQAHWKMGESCPVLKNLFCLDHVRDLVCDICGADVEGVLPPVIITQPVAQSVTVGDTVTLTVQVSGENITHCQWYAIDKAPENAGKAYILMNNTVYSGVNTTTLQINTAGYAFCQREPLDYYFVATNAGGNTGSAHVSVTVAHKASEQVTVVTPSTCKVAGKGKKLCTACGGDAVTDIDLPLADHKDTDKFTTVLVPSTCKEHGVGRVECNTCNTIITEVVSLPLSDTHNYGKYVYNNDATTKKDGTKTRTCADCGKKETVTAKGTKISNPFIDVKEKAYYFDAVLWAVEKGVTNGTSRTTFSPNDTCTRGQIATFLWRAAGQPTPKSAKNPFKDVNTKDYYYKAVLWAVGAGVTSGTSRTTFSPDESCTRGQVAAFLYRAEGSPSIKGISNPFKDVKQKDYYYQAVLWAVKNEITNGTTQTTFGPSETCTRGQIATFLYRNYK